MRKSFSDKSGFTLIEVIVVIVIMAILAAAAIPTMIGFVENAEEQKLMQEARLVYIASESVLMKRMYSDLGKDEGDLEKSPLDAIFDPATGKLSEWMVDLLSDSIDTTAIQVMKVKFKPDNVSITYLKYYNAAVDKTVHLNMEKGTATVVKGKDFGSE